MRLLPKIRFLGIAAAAFAGTSLHAQEFFWEPSSGTNLDWNIATNWAPNTAFPDGAGITARVDQDLLNAQLIRLREDITVGTLVLGDAAATGGNFGFTIGNLTGETFALTFESGVANVAAQLNLSTSGTPTNALSVPILLNSNLAINLGAGTQILSITNSGSLSTGTGLTARNVTVTGGTTATNQFNLNGNLTDSGTFTNSSNASVIVNGSKSFTGTFVLNRGIGGSNTGSLTVTGGSIASSAEVIINGFLSGSGAVQNGGSLHSGNFAPAPNNPGQRLTNGRITLNGGTISDVGQTATVGTTNPWQMGLEVVQDAVSVLDFNSGFSHIFMNIASNTTGTILDIDSVERSPGASVYLRSSTLGQANGSRFLVGNAANFLVGAGGAELSTTMSIVPWIGANNTSSATAVPTGLATNTANGIRALNLATEYATSITAGSTENVNTAAVALTSPTTVNSLRYSGGGTSNIGTGQILAITSGGLFFAAGNGTIGASGNPLAGAIDFDEAEGVIWAIGTNSNTIGAALSGSLGLSKAGTGRLILTGANTYSGLTYVGGGILQVGDGLNISNLGLSGDVAVANGATLALFNGLAIADNATLKLEQFGLFNGLVNLNLGVEETVGSLFLGDLLATPGTYGSTLSSATFQNDTFFSGPGVLTVVPEPGSALLIVAGTLVAGLRRRRAS